MSALIAWAREVPARRSIDDLLDRLPSALPLFRSVIRRGWPSAVLARRPSSDVEADRIRLARAAPLPDAVVAGSATEAPAARGVIGNDRWPRRSLIVGVPEPCRRADSLALDEKWAEPGQPTDDAGAAEAPLESERREADRPLLLAPVWLELDA